MKLKFQSLLAVFVFMILANVANAQNEYLANTGGSLGDGDNPYVGTSYTYNVNSGGGTIKWLVYSTNDLDPTKIVDPGAAIPAYSIVDAGIANASITWNTPGTYYLTYEETHANLCVTRRGVTVVVTNNTFQLAMLGDKDAVCNVKEGLVLNYDNYDGVDAGPAGEEVITTVKYEINMTKDGSFNINSWEFKGDFDLSSVTGLTIADAADVTTNFGTLVVGGANNDTFTLKGMTAAEDAIIITVKVTGLVTASGVIPLAITEGKALSGPTSLIVTNNSNTSNQSQSNELKPLPAASNITF